MGAEGRSGLVQMVRRNSRAPRSGRALGQDKRRAIYQCCRRKKASAHRADCGRAGKAARGAAQRAAGQRGGRRRRGARAARRERGQRASSESAGLKQILTNAAQLARGAAGQVDRRRVESGSARPAAKYLAVHSDAKAGGGNQQRGARRIDEPRPRKQAADARPSCRLAAGAMKSRGKTGARPAGAHRSQTAHKQTNAHCPTTVDDCIEVTMRGAAQRLVAALTGARARRGARKAREGAKVRQSAQRAREAGAGRASARRGREKG